MLDFIKPKYAFRLRTPMQIFLILVYLLLGVLYLKDGITSVAQSSQILELLLPLILIIFSKNHAELICLPFASYVAVNVLSVIFRPDSLFQHFYLRLISIALILLWCVFLGLIFLSLYSEIPISFIKLCAVACLTLLIFRSFITVDENGIELFTGLTNIIEEPLLYLHLALPFIPWLGIEKHNSNKINLFLVVAVLLLCLVFIFLNVFKFFDYSSQKDNSIQPQYENCQNCDGSGTVYGFLFCENCQGQGSIQKYCSDCDGHGTKYFSEPCSYCDGQGSTFRYCNSCNGEGQNYGDEICYSCDGLGGFYQDCPNCNGSGSNQREESCIPCNGSGVFTYNCSSCYGNRGSDTSTPCPHCDGRGKIEIYD